VDLESGLKPALDVILVVLWREAKVDWNSLESVGPETERIEEIEFLLLARLRGSGVFDIRLADMGGASSPPGSLPRDKWAYEALFLLVEEPVRAESNDALLFRPELMALGGRDLTPLKISSAIASSSPHACRMRSFSPVARLSWETEAVFTSTSSIKVFVKPMRA
jgi:hypothetical protein